MKNNKFSEYENRQPETMEVSKLNADIFRQTGDYRFIVAWIDKNGKHCTLMTTAFDKQSAIQRVAFITSAAAKLNETNFKSSDAPPDEAILTTGHVIEVRTLNTDKTVEIAFR